MKKPTLKRFKELAMKHGGNKTKIAAELGVGRLAVHEWCKSDADFAAAITEQRGEAFDKVLQSSVLLATGIPKMRKGKVVGWVEKPDPKIAIYLLSTLGKEEDFGAIEVSHKVKVERRDPKELLGEIERLGVLADLCGTGNDETEGGTKP